MTDSKRAAVLYRVSHGNGSQTTDNQVPDVEAFAAHHGLAIVRTYEITDSAWKDGQGGPEYRKVIQRMLDDAWKGDFSTVIVWRLDRAVRTGAEEALKLIRQLRERGATLVSVHESWLNGSPEVQDVLVAFAGWMAQMESTKRSERVKAGLARRAAEGKPVGRQPGAGDRKPRRRSGYVKAWEDRKAAQDKP